jgi:hypothetical protein
VSLPDEEVEELIAEFHGIESEVTFITLLFYVHLVSENVPFPSLCSLVTLRQLKRKNHWKRSHWKKLKLK